MGADAESGNLGRFSGFADLYDAHRASPPEALGTLLASYARVLRPAVVDLGSGTGLSSRWAAGWAGSVIGVEPNADMRAVAEAQPLPNVRYAAAVAESTGLPDRCADVALAVQAMHWMDPTPTLAEAARLLRPSGVFAVIDVDWPPVVGDAASEHAWAVLHRRIRVLESRASRGHTGPQMRAPILEDDPALSGDDLADPHRDRAMPGGVVSWSKSDHLHRIRSSNHFGFAREVVLSEASSGGADRFIALMRSQGSYQGLRRLGLDDDQIGMTDFVASVRAGLTDRPDTPLTFCWRVRLGVTSTPAGPSGPG